jgi:lipid-A-disaccharide synthase
MPPESGSTEADASRGPEPAVLFTAFEPSGDDHAAAVIAELKAAHPGLRVYAWGGSEMAEAGAEMIERTGEDAVMGLPGLAKIREHRRINARVRSWLREHPEVRLHVPVDSPAANFPICRIARSLGLGVVHLVAPQVWAWGGWRIRKLRRLTDRLLCLLPFEEPWFQERGIEAKFIGHPLFDREVDGAALDAQAVGFPEGEPRLALLPGSRPAEIARNWPLLLEAYREIRRRRPEAVGVVAATTPGVAERVRAVADAAGGWPESLRVEVDAADAVVRWSDLALVVSGTVTLQIARHRRPMIIVYKSSPLLYMLLARWVLSTEFLTLPNLIAGREIVPELVPHFGGHEPIVEQAMRLIESPEVASRQRAELGRVVERFAGHHAGREAAGEILDKLGLPRPVSSAAPA